MSVATALTIIAISMGILAILAILGFIFMLRLTAHLMAFEQTVVRELAELKQLAAQLRETSERVGQTVHDVQVTARRLGGAVGTVASLLSIVFGRSRPTTRLQRLRPWWITGASVGLSLLRRRRQAKKPKSRRQERRNPSTSGNSSDSSLTL